MQFIRAMLQVMWDDSRAERRKNNFSAFRTLFTAPE